MTVDRSLLERLEAVKAAQDRMPDGSGSGVFGGGDPPNPPGMEALIARVDGLEKGVGKIDGRLDGIDTRLRGVESTLAGISAKLDIVASKLPTWLQMTGAVSATVSIVAVVLAMLARFVIAK